MLKNGIFASLILLKLILIWADHKKLLVKLKHSVCNPWSFPYLEYVNSTKDENGFYCISYKKCNQLTKLHWNADRKDPGISTMPNYVYIFVLLSPFTSFYHLHKDICVRNATLIYDKVEIKYHKRKHKHFRTNTFFCSSTQKSNHVLDRIVFLILFWFFRA